MKTNVQTEADRRKRKVARDGETVRAPMLLMDGLRAAIANASSGLSTFDSTGHKPGFVTLADEDRAARQAMYDRYEKALVNRYRNAPALAPDPTRDAKPTQIRPATTVHADNREAMYAAADRRLTERWRGAA